MARQFDEEDWQEQGRVEGRAEFAQEIINLLRREQKKESSTRIALVKKACRDAQRG